MFDCRVSSIINSRQVHECTTGRGATTTARACNSVELRGADETITNGKAKRKAAKIFFIVDVERWVLLCKVVG